MKGSSESELMFENFHIEPTGALDKLSEREKQLISDDLVNFLQRYRKRFDEAHMHMHIKQHKEKFREKPLMYCILNLTTDNGKFHSSAEGWGAEQAVHNALDSIETQIKKKFGKAETQASIRRQAIRRVAGA